MLHNKSLSAFLGQNLCLPLHWYVLFIKKSSLWETFCFYLEIRTVLTESLITWWNNNHLKLNLSKTNEPAEDFNALNLNVVQICEEAMNAETQTLYTHLQPRSTEGLENQHSFEVDTQKQCHQFSTGSNGIYGNNLSFCS